MFTYFEKPDDIKDEVELDLSICHRVAEELGGELYRDDRYEHGTRMVLVLPIQ
jgi:signal transduction histidine kinase